MNATKSQLINFGRLNFCEPRQHSNCWFWVPRDSWPHFSVTTLGVVQLPKSKSHYDRRSVGQSGLASSHFWGTTRVSRSVKLLLALASPVILGFRFSRDFWLRDFFCVSEWLNYDRRSVGLSVLVSSPMWGSRPDINYYLTVTVFYSMSGAPSDGGRVCHLS
jgi:hypothetical protein